VAVSGPTAYPLFLGGIFYDALKSSMAVLNILLLAAAPAGAHSEL